VAGWGSVGTGLCLGQRALRARALALNLAQDLGGDGRVEVDGVVSQALRGLVALAAATLKGFPHTDLRAVTILGVVLDAVHILTRQGREDALRKGEKCNEPPFHAVVDAPRHLWMERTELDTALEAGLRSFLEKWFRSTGGFKEGLFKWSNWEVDLPKEIVQSYLYCQFSNVKHTENPPKTFSHRHKLERSVGKSIFWPRSITRQTRKL